MSALQDNCDFCNFIDEMIKKTRDCDINEAKYIVHDIDL